MARKRMILEEIEEKEQLVVGSVDNPIRLGEKQKSALLKIHMAGEKGLTNNNSLGYDSWAKVYECLDRLTYLQLIENRELVSTPAQKRKIDQELASLATAGGAAFKKDPVSKEVRDIQEKVNQLRGDLKQKAWFLTSAGKELLLKGKITIVI